MTCLACSILSMSVGSTMNYSLSAELMANRSVDKRMQRLPLGCLLVTGRDAVVGFITIGCCWCQIWPNSRSAFYYG